MFDDNALALAASLSFAGGMGVMAFIFLLRDRERGHS